MTTFSRAEAAGEAWSLDVELKSVNSRFLDAHIRMPRQMSGLEDRIRKFLKERLVRGRVDLFINYESLEESSVTFRPDIALAEGYVQAARRLKMEVGLPGELEISHLLQVLRDAITAKEEPADMELLWSRLAPVLEDAVAAAEKMSEAEAANLVSDISARLDRIEALVEEIGKRAPERLEEAKSALKERISSLLDEAVLDESRLAQEVAILTDRMDITEELVRARSHIDQFRRYLDKGGEVGRRLDFLVQEIFREVNTISSKASDSSISQTVVEIKGELEKIREQVQNLV
jgi:uncharacterized protein (TIGR00255 family)